MVSQIQSSMLFVGLLLAFCSFTAVQGFSTVASSASGRTTTALQAVSSDDSNNNESSPLGRRQVLSSFLTAAVAGTALSVAPAASHATYSAYTHREQDWESRKSTGDVQFSSARDLRAQLREIAPQNSERSKIFCPNGPSAAVSPLMENKCDDVRMALPSVYGRQDDVLGNSIPGFSSTWKASASDVSISASAGGFPSYSGVQGKANKGYFTD